MSVTIFPNTVAYTKPPTSIINYCSDGGVYVTNVSAGQIGGKSYDPSTLTAGTYKSVLDVTGRGVILVCGVYKSSTSTTQVGLKLNVDGVTVFDAYSSSTSLVNAGLMAVGYSSNASYTKPVVFNSSFEVFIKSSADENPAVTFAAVAYHIA